MSADCTIKLTVLELLSRAFDAFESLMLDALELDALESLMH